MELDEGENPRDAATKQFLQQRRVAYARLFGMGEPTDKDIEVVMDDLAKFCRAFETTFHADPRMHAVLEGRREVFLRILEHSMIPFEELFNRYHRRGR
ncbi:hypothetical protein [Hyphomicrobium sp. DY-1]|uniref:Bbp19 family protein n=1 Tax=Hyphomicrobium sp. DY-1 TaxID=3075650 RepID=UPI0039C26F96